MLISAKPLLRYLRRRCLSDQEVNALSEQVLYFHLGRDALLYVLSEINASKDRSLLFPAYYCESALTPLRASGYKLDYFDVSYDLSWDLRNIVAHIQSNECGVLIFPNLFGMQAIDLTEVSRCCDENGVTLIMDFSHSFFSFDISSFQKPPKPVACIFSMRKMLPTSDGGALFICDLPKQSVIPSSVLGDVLFIIRNYIARFVFTIGVVNIYAGFINKIKNRGNNKNGQTVDVDTGERVPNKPSFTLFSQLGNKKYISEIAKCRVEHFKRLYSLIGEVAPELLYMKLAIGAIPQVLPLIDESGSLVQYLRSQGIGAYCWPGDELPLEVKNDIDKYPNATILGSSVVCLPIHQDIKPKHINYMIDTISAWKNRQDHE